MHTATRVLVTLTALVAASCGTLVPTYADVPPNVRDGHADKLSAGWVNAACATTADGVKCRLGYPQGARRIVLTTILDGAVLEVQRTYPYREHHRATRAPQRAAGGLVVDGVRLDCSNAGQRVECVLDLAGRFHDVNVTSYVRGWAYGGLRGKGLTR